MRKTPLFRLFTTLLLAVTILSAVPHSVSAMGEIAGQVLATDITAYINGYPIPTYNIGGKLSVIVSDLRQYGFTTVYNDATRTSSVSLPNQIEAKSTITPLAVTKSAAAVGSFVMNVYKKRHHRPGQRQNGARLQCRRENGDVLLRSRGVRHLRLRQ